MKKTKPGRKKRRRIKPLTGKHFNEKTFQRMLADLVSRYDAAMIAPDKEKKAFDDEWNEFVLRCTEDQAKRAMKLLELHVGNKATADGIDNRLGADDEDDWDIDDDLGDDER